MVSNYEFITKLKSDDTFKELIRRGLVSLSFESYYIIYEHYKSSLKTSKTRSDAITSTANEFNISESGVYVIIRKMK